MLTTIFYLKIMNTYAKYCPNVYVAKCTEQHQKGDVIIVETRHGKENESIVHNLVKKDADYFYYSITRADGFNAQERARNKAERYGQWADGADKKSDQYYEASNEGREFLSLGEPIKVGHHSERRHRALFERNWNRMEKSVNAAEKADAHRQRAAYWESLADTVNLSMPESIEFFEVQLEEAIEYHTGLKDGTIQREHSYSLTYAKKRVNDIKKKLEIAKKLWG